MKDFPKFEGSARFRAEQLMGAAASIDPTRVPEGGLGLPVVVGYDPAGKPVYETVRVVARKSGGESYLMVA